MQGRSPASEAAAPDQRSGPAGVKWSQAGGAPNRFVLRRRRSPETPAGPCRGVDKLRSGICRLTGLERSGENFLKQGRLSPRPSPKEINNIF